MNIWSHLENIFSTNLSGIYFENMNTFLKPPHQFKIILESLILFCKKIVLWILGHTWKIFSQQIKEAITFKNKNEILRPFP